MHGHELSATPSCESKEPSHRAQPPLSLPVPPSLSFYDPGWFSLVAASQPEDAAV